MLVDFCVLTAAFLIIILSEFKWRIDHNVK